MFVHDCVGYQVAPLPCELDWNDVLKRELPTTPEGSEELDVDTEATIDEVTATADEATAIEKRATELICYDGQLKAGECFYCRADEIQNAIKAFCTLYDGAIIDLSGSKAPKHYSQN